jgi:hypothetical protein
MKPTTHRLMIAGIAAISLVTIALVPKADKRVEDRTERTFKALPLGPSCREVRIPEHRGPREVVAPGAIW